MTQWRYAFSFLFCLLHSAIGQSSKICSKIDFNRAVVNDFRECYQQFLPVLRIKKYADETGLQSYRPGTEFFLSPFVEGYSCVESVSVFQLDENSVIQAAVYLSFVDAGAFVRLIVVDLQENKEAISWRYEKSADWFMVAEKVGMKINRAMIEIRTNMNKRSVLGFEYLNVVNDAIGTPECAKDAPPPSTTTTTAATSTIISTSTVFSTVSQDPVSTEANTQEPSDDDSIFRWDIFWIIVASLIAVSVLSVVLGLSYVFVIRPRIFTQTMEVTRPADDVPTDSKYQYETPDVQTLPRLHVLHDPIEGPYISGINYIKHLNEDGSTRK